MSGRRRIDALESALTLLSQMEPGDSCPGTVEQLRELLRSPSNRVVAAAAELIQQHDRRDLVDDLRANWDRFLDDPAETDKGCIAKSALVEALSQLDYDDPDFYLTGMQYRQLEAAWGEPEDTAINLRGTCGFALVASRMISVNRKLKALVAQMANPHRVGRMHAIQAIGDLGSEHGIPVLCMKLHGGDAEADVIGACFSALLQLDPKYGVQIIKPWLESSGNPALSQEAAAALGASNRDPAIQLLIDATETSRLTIQREFLIASLGLSRNELAISCLIDLIREASVDSERAIEALAPTRFYPQIFDRVREAARNTQQSRLIAVFDEYFSDR